MLPLACWLWLAAVASPGGIEGTLVDKVTGEPVLGAPVRLDGREPFVIADELGRFRFPAVPAGPHRLQVLDPEHVPLEIEVVVRPAQTLVLELALERPGAEEVEQIVVRAERLEAEVSDTVLEMRRVEKLPGTQGDLIKIIESLPGVARTSSINTSKFTSTRLGAAVIRGAAPEDSQVLIDGHPVPLLYHFGSLKSILNADMLGRIDFLPGAFGAEYGGLIGGVVDVRTRPCRGERFSGYADVGMLDAGFFLEGPAGPDAAFVAAARRSTLDAWLPAVMPDEPGLALTLAPAYYDYQAKLDWTPDSGDRLSLLAFGLYDELRFLNEKPISGDPSLRGRLDYWVQYHKVLLTWLHESAQGVSLAASASFGYDREHLVVFTNRTFDTTAPAGLVRLDLAWQPSPDLSLRAGLATGITRFSSVHRFPRPAKEGQLVPDFERLELVEGNERETVEQAALYLSGSLRPLERLLLTGGLRLSGWAGPVNAAALTPRLALRAELRQGTEFKAAAGWYRQAPQFDESSEQFGTRALGLESAWHFTVGLEQRLPAGLTLTCEAFAKQLDRLVTPDPQRVYSNRGRGRIGGLELWLRREAARGPTGWLAYTLMHSLRQDGEGQPWRLFDFDQLHLFTLVVGWRLGGGDSQERPDLPAGWEFGLRFQLASNNPYTPYHGGVYDADSDSFLPLAGPINSARLPLYYRLDLRVDYSFRFTRWALTVSLELQNATNHKNAEEPIYNYDFSQRAYLHGLPLLPFLGLRASF